MPYDRKSTRLNSSHGSISYAVFCLKKKKRSSRNSARTDWPAAAPMGEFGIGQPVERFEDPRLLRGEGRFIHDLNLPGQAHVVLVRSPHAHARIVAARLAVARAAPGVLGAFTVEDL